MKNIIKSVIYGGIIGDSVGLPFEFKSREVLKSNPASDMIGFGTHNLPPGSWTDDTSMCLAAMDSIAEGLDFHDISVRFCNWYFKSEYTPFGKVFDIGNTTRQALENFAVTNDHTNSGLDSEYNNGNGSLMRMYPISLYLMNETSLERKFRIISTYSSITHAHPISILSCMIYDEVLRNIISNTHINEEVMTSGLYELKKFIAKNFSDFYDNFDSILSGNIFQQNEENIQSTGYVIYTLEAALWSLSQSNSFPDAILKAVNLGNDTDTIASVTGSLAGAYYGFENIPENWMMQLENRELLDKVISKFISSLSIV